MFKKLLQFEIFYQVKQRAFPLFALLFLVLGVTIGGQGFAPKGVNFNSAYQIYFYTNIFTLGSVFIIMFFAISAMLRDKQHNMEGLIYSSSIEKALYFWSRFLGTFIFSVLAFSPFLLGNILGNYFSGLNPERIADFQVMTYLQPWLYIVLPNIFICTTIVFSVCTLTKNTTATYVSAVFVYMLYLVSSIFLNSPLMAQAVPASPESMVIAALADPFGIAAFFEQTQFWTPFQKNTQLLSFSGLFLWNRLVWIFVSLGILLTAYSLFSFRKVSNKVKKELKEKKVNTKLIAYKPIQSVYNFKAQKLAFFSLLKLELKSVFKSLPFIAVMIMWLFFVFSNVYATAVSGQEYGVSVYPFTNQLIELIVNPLKLFGLLLIVFYSSEIVWRERSANFNTILDATPAKNWVFFTSKLMALIILPLLLITSAIIICILFQISLNFKNFQLDLYASVYYHYGLQLVIFCVIALFVNTLVKSKYLGMGIFGVIVLLTLNSGILGLEHPLTSLDYLPSPQYSNMNGFGGVSNLFDHLALYWFAFGLLLTIVSFKLWNRGLVPRFSIKLKQFALYWTKGQKFAIAIVFVLFLSAGSLVYLNMASDYETMNEKLEFRENYELKFKKYSSIDRLIPTSKKTVVNIYPKERRYALEADYMLKNKSDQPLSELFITERIPLENISLENAQLVAHDSIYGTYVFKYNTPLQPNDSIRFTYKLKKEVKGYQQDNSIVKNGTYLNKFVNFEPFLGYTSTLEISNGAERKKRNLPERIEQNNSDAHIVLGESKYEKVSFETIISTSNDQTAISSGRLINKWSENNRNYFHYKSAEKIIPEIGYFSAKYASKKTDYKGILIEQYYDVTHDFNIENIENSVKETLDYCQENFGTYAFDHVRIAEVPSYWPFGGFAHPGVISMVEDRLYLADVSNEKTFNLVAKRTIHEVSHQYWGHTLTAKPVAGASLFVEGFAKYTEAVVLEKMYGKSILFPLTENARSRYFSGRTFEGGIEPPVYKVRGQGYISYGKALTVMLGLRDLIGEKQVNKVLKIITDRHRSINKFEGTTIELLDEIYKVTSPEQRDLVDDWFKKVITYDLKVDEASYKKLADGTFEVSATINSNRFETLDSGEIQEIEMNEPIKIGVFRKHPSKVAKDEQSILYYESHQISNELTKIKIIVTEKPVFISVDPYGTRLDENLVDNIMSL